MKKPVLYLLAFLAVYSFYRVAVTGIERPVTWSKSIAKLEEASFDQTISEAPPWMVVHVWATWCSICKQAKPDYNEIADQFPEEVGFYHLDVDQNPEWADTYRVKDGVPSTLIFYRGQEIARHTGRLPRKAMINWISHTTSVQALPDS